MPREIRRTRRTATPEEAEAELPEFLQIRRAIAAAGIHPVDRAAAAAIPLPDLLDFMCGDGPLDTAAVDRLAAHLHCELVQPL